MPLHRHPWGSPKQLCSKHRQAETSFASGWSVWCHVWKVGQEPSSRSALCPPRGLARVPAASPILGSPARLRSEHNPFPCTAGEQKMLHGMETQPSRTHRRKLCSPQFSVPLPAAGGKFGRGGSGEAKASRITHPCSNRVCSLPASHQHLSHEMKPSDCTEQPTDDLSKSTAKEPYEREANISLRQARVILKAAAERGLESQVVTE